MCEANLVCMLIGTTDTVTIIPTSKPVTQLTLRLSIRDTRIASVSMSMLQWNTITWQTSYTVTVTGLRYPIHNDTSDHITSLALSVTSGDANYQTLSVNDVT